MSEQIVQWKWQGESGNEYTYWVYPINTAFKDQPGNYIYAKRTRGGWQAIYIGQTSSLSQRLASHETEQAAIRHGATHIHAHLSGHDEQSRRIEETDLIGHHRPPCNHSIADEWGIKVG
jgi:hypothetical protein